jgi:hypothetical protein
MERLILLLHTVPYDNVPLRRYAVAGGIPVGVEGRGGRGGRYDADMVLGLIRLLLCLLHGRRFQMREMRSESGSKRVRV